MDIFFCAFRRPSVTIMLQQSLDGLCKFAVPETRIFMDASETSRNDARLQLTTLCPSNLNLIFFFLVFFHLFLFDWGSLFLFNTEGGSVPKRLSGVEINRLLGLSVELAHDIKLSHGRA